MPVVRSGEGRKDRSATLRVCTHVVRGGAHDVQGPPDR